MSSRRPSDASPEGPFHSGFVAVVGRPNTGKSTLVNALVGEKVSIVTDKPQTTRARIRGVLTTDTSQLVFTDTPGFHKPRTLLGRRLNEMVGEGTTDVDVVMLVVDAEAGIGRGDAYVAQQHVAPLPCSKICVVNKIDRMRGGGELPQLQAASELMEFDHIVPVSAKTGRGVPELLEILTSLIPVGPRFFEPGEVTDRPMEARVADVIREKALAATREEVPHSVAVLVEEMERTDGLVRISAFLYVERDSQKGILIGHGGSMLKRIGSLARAELEPLLGEKVFLDLRVKVQREWQRDPLALDRFGFRS